jgi:hypothetical protein
MKTTNNNNNIIISTTIYLLIITFIITTNSNSYTQAADTTANSLRSSITQHLTATTTSSPTFTIDPNTTPHACQGGTYNPIIRTDIYYVLEFKSHAKNQQTRYFGRGFPLVVRSPYNGFILSIDGATNDDMFAPNIPLQSIDTTDMGNPRLHFRFELLSDGVYRLISGHSGQYVNIFQSTSTDDHNDYLLSTHPSDYTKFFITFCDADGYVSLIAATAWKSVREHSNNAQFAISANSWSETFDTSCCDSCPAGTTRISENTMSCVFCDTETCSRPLGPYEYQQIAVKFKMYESPAYYAPDVVSVTPQVLGANLGNQYIAIIGSIMKTGLQVASNRISYGSWVNVAGNIVNKFGKMATVASVGLGVLSFALDFAIKSQQPTIEDRLNSLEKVIMNNVKELVSDTVTKLAVTDAANFFKTARFKLHTEIKSAKRLGFIQKDMSLIEDTADNIQDIASTINDGLDLIKVEGIVEPFSGDRSSVIISPLIQDTQVNVKILQVGYTLYVSAVMDMISALSEAVMLKSYAKPELNCTDVMDFYGLTAHADRQGFFLEQMASFLYFRRANQITVKDTETTVTTVHDALTGDNVYYPYTFGPGPNVVADSIMNLYRNEIRFDMETYSYRFNPVKEGLNNLVQTTYTLCEKLKTDEVFKQDYANCAQGIGQGCDLISGGGGGSG